MCQLLSSTQSYESVSSSIQKYERLLGDLEHHYNVALTQFDQAVASRPFNVNTDSEPQFMLIQSFAWMMYQMINQARALDQIRDSIPIQNGKIIDNQCLKNINSHIGQYIAVSDERMVTAMY